MDMPKGEKSHLYFPRQKEGEDPEPGPLTRHIRVNYEALEGLFHLNLKDAAKELGEANPGPCWMLKKCETSLTRKL
jgi:hypothetical protein